MIVIHLESDHYSAEFFGEEGERVLELFGTRVIPTAFTNKCHAGTVQTRLQELNPSERVYLCECTTAKECTPLEEVSR